MPRFMTVLSTCLVITSLAGAAVEAAALTKVEKVALKQAIVACKAEAKGKKIKWLSRRTYVNQCVVTALKERPSIDVGSHAQREAGANEYSRGAMAGILGR